MMPRVLENPETVLAGQDIFVMPCSTSQKRFWMLEQISPGDTALLIPIAVQLSGPLDVDVLERALNGIVQRHEILRTSFALVDGEPSQVIAPAVTLTLQLLDFGSVPERERKQRISQIMSEEAARPVSLTEAPLLRATLVQVGPEDALLMLTAHHIISDGWSNGLLVRELNAFYHAVRKGEPPDLPPLAIQYADYVLWQSEWLKSPDFDKQLNYWKGALEGEIPVLDLPADFVRGGGETHEAILESRVLPAALTEALKSFCREEGTTLFMVFFSAYVVLLHRYTGQSRLMVGTTGANRNRPELEGLIGLFSNILLLRAEVSGKVTFREFLSRQRDHLLNSFANHEAPFERVVEQWQAGKRRMPKNLIQTHFLFQKAFMQPVTCDGLTIRPLYSVSPGSTFELTFGIVERAEGIRLQMEYWTTLFRRSTIQRMLEHYQTLLEAVVANPELPIANLPLFSPRERVEMEALLNRSVVKQERAEAVLDPAKFDKEIDHQIEEHFRQADEPFVSGTKLPEGSFLVAMDEHHELLPVGIPGELYLGDDFGRLKGRDDAVSGMAAFPVTLLKTKFLGRNAEGGRVEIWGRAEDIIALPIFRFNRRVIDLRLRLHPEVQDSFAAVKPDSHGEAKLIGYVVRQPKGTVSGEDLRAFLRGHISDLLVPSTIVIVDSLPRDGEGNVLPDQLALPEVPKISAPSYVPLQGVLQQQLIEIWREILKKPEISLHDNFFELGGNSFRALRMMIAAGDLCRRTLPLSLLLSGATVANLARHIIEANSKAETATQLIPVQAKGSRTPLFFLHGDWVGGGFYCNRLSQQLGEEQPFYALPPYRATGDRVASIAEMAAQHRLAAQKVSPKGPYVLGGYCIGALVALEMARQWVAEGETVAHLFLIDPPVWADAWLKRMWPFFDRLGEMRGWTLQKRISFFDRYGVTTNRRLKRGVDRTYGTILRAFGLRGRSTALSASMKTQDSEGEDILESLGYSVYFLAYRLHELERISVPTTLFIPAATSSRRLEKVISASKLDPVKCRIEIIPGNHTTCVTQDTSVLVERMQSILDVR